MSTWSQAFQNVGGKSVDAWKDIEIFRAKESVILFFVVAALFVFVAMTGVMRPKVSQTPKQCYEACIQKHCMGGRCFADEDQKCRVDCNYPSGN